MGAGHRVLHGVIGGVRCRVRKRCQEHFPDRLIRDCSARRSWSSAPRIRRRGLRHRFTGDLIVWGSLSLSDALLRANEVDVLRLRVLPVLLGRGRSFTPSDLGLRRLSLATAQSFAGGLVVLEYHAAP